MACTGFRTRGPGWLIGPLRPSGPTTFLETARRPHRKEVTVKIRGVGEVGPTRDALGGERGCGARMARTDEDLRRGHCHWGEPPFVCPLLMVNMVVN